MENWILNDENFYTYFPWARFSVGKTALELCVDQATWVVGYWNSIHGMTRPFQMGLRRAAATHYAKMYFERHQRLPEGAHVVVVSYGSPGTADIVPPFGEHNKGMLRVEVFFPENGWSPRPTISATT